MGGHEGGGLGGVRRDLVLHVIGEEDPLQGDRSPVHRVGPHDRCQRSLDVVTGVELVLLDARQGIRRPGNQVLRQGRFRFSQLLRVDESEQPGRHPPAGLVDEGVDLGESRDEGVVVAGKIVGVVLGISVAQQWGTSFVCAPERMFWTLAMASLRLVTLTNFMDVLCPAMS